jgi:hypothetical protein
LRRQPDSYTHSDAYSYSNADTNSDADTNSYTYSVARAECAEQSSRNGGIYDTGKSIVDG